MKYLLLTTILFIGCKSQRIDATLYQPNQLFLEGGKEIHTMYGNYSPVADEVWFSARKVEEMEKKLSQF